MAITFSKSGTSTTISNITFTRPSGSSSVDVAVFSKDSVNTVVYSSTATYTFPNSNAKMTGSSGDNNTIGFNATGSTAKYVTSGVNLHYCAFDNNSGTTFTTTSGQPSLILTFIDPSATSNKGLGDVFIKKITISKPSNLDGAIIYVGQSNDVASDPMGSGAKGFATVTGNTGKTITYTAPSNLENYASNCIRIYKSSSSGDVVFGNITIEFDVSAAKLAAWKSRYSIS